MLVVVVGVVGVVVVVGVPSSRARVLGPTTPYPVVEEPEQSCRLAHWYFCTASLVRYPKLPSAVPVVRYPFDLRKVCSSATSVPLLPTVSVRVMLGPLTVVDNGTCGCGVVGVPVVTVGVGVPPPDGVGVVGVTGVVGAPPPPPPLGGVTGGVTGVVGGGVVWFGVIVVNV